MTVTDSIMAWLKTNSDFEVLDNKNTDFLKAQAESAGLYKQPSDTVTEMVDGSKRITSYYFVLLRQAAKLENDRKSNQTFLEDLEKWVDKQNFAGILPIGINCSEVNVSNSFYMQEMDEDEAIYQISLAVEYTRERN